MVVTMSSTWWTLSLCTIFGIGALAGAVTFDLVSEWRRAKKVHEIPEEFRHHFVGRPDGEVEITRPLSKAIILQERIRATQPTKH
jgi:hypothetical protein